jgi:hypothetical protein
MVKKSMILVLIIAAVAVMAYGLLGAGAWFSDTVTSPPVASLHSGTLSINDGALVQHSIGTIDNMAPGDKTGDVVLYITNNGNIPLAWFGDLVIDGPDMLKDAIYIDNAQMEFLGGNWDEATDNFITNGVGSGPYPDWYNHLASLSSFNVVSLSVFDGNAAMGSVPYEFKGALKPGYAYRLTLRFGFAETAGNDYQNLGPLNLTFKVDATQVTAGALDALLPGQSGDITWFNTQLANQD